MAMNQPSVSQLNDRQLSASDSVIDFLDRGLRAVFAGQHAPQRANPAQSIADTPLPEEQSRHVAGLMRVNHTGEVCAQALYYGQAAVAKNREVEAQMVAAAEEETDHLIWCEQRLSELESRPSLFNPLWYSASFAIGALAGLRGDGWNLGFVVETERQVEAHLDSHLRQLPESDEKSRAILSTMKEDEARHADQALESGGRILPPLIRRAMAATAKVMKWFAYRA